MKKKQLLAIAQYAKNIKGEMKNEEKAIISDAGNA